eukprot:g33050.t1
MGETVHAVHPAVVFIGEYLGGSLLDWGWDRATNKPNIREIEKRLKRLEQNAAIHPLMQAQIKALRESINERTTRAEFQRLASMTTARINSLESRMYDAEQRIEKLEVENQDLKNGTKNAESPDHFIEKAEVYEARREYYKAIAAYSIAIELQKENPEYYRRRAEAFLKLDAAGIAGVDMKQAVRLKPKDAISYYVRGIIHAEMREYRKAVTDFSTAIRLRPKYADAYYSRSAIEARLGNISRSRADLQQALALDPARIWFTYSGRDVDRYVSHYNAGGKVPPLAQDIPIFGETGPASFRKWYGVERTTGSSLGGSGDVLCLARPATAADITRRLIGKSKFERFTPIEVGPHHVYVSHDVYHRGLMQTLAREVKRKPAEVEDCIRRFYATTLKTSLKPRAFCLIDSKTYLRGPIDSVVKVLTRFSHPGRDSAVLKAIATTDPEAADVVVIDLLRAKYNEFKYDLSADGKKPVPGVDFKLLGRELRLAKLESKITDTLQIKLSLVCRHAARAADCKRELERILVFLANAAATLPRKLPPELIARLRKPGLTISGSAVQLNWTLTAKEIGDIRAVLCGCCQNAQPAKREAKACTGAGDPAVDYRVAARRV